MKQEKNNLDMIHHLPRLKWACRRGMLELDVLLGNFLESGYPGLPDEDKKLFITLLEKPDPDIFSWLMGNSVPEDPDMVKITEIMRHHAKSRI